MHAKADWQNNGGQIDKDETEWIVLNGQSEFLMISQPFCPRSESNDGRPAEDVARLLLLEEFDAMVKIMGMSD